MYIFKIHFVWVVVMGELDSENCQKNVSIKTVVGNPLGYRFIGIGQ